MHNLTWEDSAAQLREAHENKNSKTVGLLVSEIAMRWEKVKIGNFKIIPLRRLTHGVLGPGVIVFDYHSDLPPERIVQNGQQISYIEPYSNLLVLIRENQTFEDFALEWLEASNIGPAISAIMSFVLRCTVIGFNEFGTPLGGKPDSPRLIFTGREWPNIWGEAFRNLEGMRGNLASYHPMPHEELDSIETMEKIYNILMNQGEKDYYSLMGALRLYQLAHFIAREDKSLAYALLVAAIDSAASRKKPGARFQDIDPEGKITRAMEEVNLDENTQKYIKSCILSGTLRTRFSNFIIENLPEDFWEGDYSITKELERLFEPFHSGQYLRDLSATMPEPQRSEIRKKAEEEEKEYEKMKRKRAELQEPSFRQERRKFMLNYLQHFLQLVLNDTYDCRSSVFHSGKEFPKKAIEGDITDEGLVLIDEDIWKFMEKHRGCREVNYYVDERNGKVTRVCLCGNTKKVKMMLEFRVFERIVHDSILNYILKLNNNALKSRTQLKN